MKKTVETLQNSPHEARMHSIANSLLTLNKAPIAHLSTAEQEQFIQFGFGSAETPAHTNVYEAFAYWCQKTPSAIAAEHQNQQISYRELDKRATIIALLLKQKGIRQGDRIGLYLPRSLHFLTGLIAILKLGAVYVPQDPRIVPANMLRTISELSEQKLILTLDSFLEDMPLDTSIAIDSTLDNPLYQNLYGNIKLINHHRYSDQSSCFILFTSGTTGTPNGVEVTHQNLCNILYTSPGNLHILPGTKVAQLLNISFDMAAWEILGCLGNGGHLLIRDKSIAATAEQAEVIIATPTILTGIDSDRCKHVKTVAVAGEPCPLILAKQWSAKANFYNCCGPTETTIVNTMHLCSPSENELSIGKPTPNNSVYILNEDRKPVAIGEVGTMWAGGNCVSKGYLNNPELNDKKYAPDPFFFGKRTMFNTGDLGKWNDHGELMHYGRIDDQVKIKGFRVELDAVTAIIERFPEVTRAVSMKFGDALVAVISPVPIFPEELTAMIREEIQKELPYYYVPGQMEFVKELPKTSRGKIDKRAVKTFLNIQNNER